LVFEFAILKAVKLLERMVNMLQRLILIGLLVCFLGAACAPVIPVVSVSPVAAPKTRIEPLHTAEEVRVCLNGGGCPTDVR